MTVSSGSLSVTHNCNGSITEFPFTFGVGGEDEVKVILTDADGNQTILVVDDDYTIEFTPIDWNPSLEPIDWDYSLGGTVTTVATYDTGNTITIKSDAPLTQEVDFIENMPTLYQIFEDGLDKLTRICKQLEERIAIMEVIVISGAPGTTDITYLGHLVSDPSTAGWGEAQAFTVWHNTTDKRAKYWNGEEILIL